MRTKRSFITPQAKKNKLVLIQSPYPKNNQEETILKNNLKKEVTDEKLQQEAVIPTEEVESNTPSEVEMKILSLEEKIGAYEEKINLIVSYLESINETNRNDVIESATEDKAQQGSEKKESLGTSEEILAKNVYEMARKDLYEELLPLVECAKKYKNREERDKVIKMMILTEEMADAADKADEMDEVIEKYPALKNSDDLMEKYVTAYVILKGRDACLLNKKKSVEELMEIFDNDEEFRKAVSLKIREDLQKQNSVPNMNFEGGITSLNIEEKPKNMQDAKNATFRLFK